MQEGGYHSLALKNDGTLWAWGYNWYGQLGNGTTTGSNVPVPVNALTGITAISAGEAHSLALKNDGTLWVWGWNNNGQLGNGTNTDSNVPVQTTGLCSIATAVNEIAEQPSVSVFPNPTSGEFQMQVDNKQSTINKVEITNVLGEQIQKLAIGSMQLANNASITLNLSANPKGIYFVKVITEDGGQTVRKVVLQ